MKLLEMMQCIENFAPLSLQEDYDNAGLITGSPDWEVKNILLSIDVTEDVILEAIEKKCNVILSHHPLIFNGIKKITGTSYVERAIILAIKNDIALYAAHTNLDNVQNGVSKKIADKLNLKNAKILTPQKKSLRKLITFCPTAQAAKVREAIFDAGAGEIGNYSECSFNAEGFGTYKAGEETKPFAGEIGKQHIEPEIKVEVIFPFYLEKKVISALLAAHPYEEVAYDIISLENSWNRSGAGYMGDLDEPLDEAACLSYLKNRMHTPVIRHSKFLNKKIKKIAVCGGAGGFLLSDAINEGADIFVTSDMKYHQFFDADEKIVIADIGHYESEQFTLEIFSEIIREKFPTFAPLFSERISNPVNYFS
jgi:dinuclear metal center YbgI/SA1388 family protein